MSETEFEYSFNLDVTFTRSVPFETNSAEFRRFWEDLEDLIKARSTSIVSWTNSLQLESNN